MGQAVGRRGGSTVPRAGKVCSGNEIASSSGAAEAAGSVRPTCFGTEARPGGYAAGKGGAPCLWYTNLLHAHGVSQEASLVVSDAGDKKEVTGVKMPDPGQRVGLS